MNISYKILWIDDSFDFFESTKELVEEIVKQHNMIATIVQYEGYEEFSKKELEQEGTEVFNQYDILVIDYALSGQTGDKIIREIRNKSIYTDIVFYSSEFLKMKDEIRKGEHLDGVFLAERENLTSVIDNVINKNLQRENNIANIRGLIMDSSSDFDYICRITAIALYDRLQDEEKATIEKRAREYIEKAAHQSDESFEKVKKANGLSFIKKVFTSVGYIINNEDRYALLQEIIQTSNVGISVPEDFSTEYKESVITPRNKLAHAKLFYGECKSKLHIAKSRQELKCDQKCEECKAQYSLKECEELRRKLFMYYIMFEAVDKATSVYIAE